MPHPDYTAIIAHLDDAVALVESSNTFDEARLDFDKHTEDGEGFLSGNVSQRSGFPQAEHEAFVKAAKEYRNALIKLSQERS